MSDACFCPTITLHVGDIADAFIPSGYQPFVHTFARTPTAESSTQGDKQLAGAVRVRASSQLGGGAAGDRTSNLPVTGQPAPPPEPLTPCPTIMTPLGKRILMTTLYHSILLQIKSFKVAFIFTGRLVTLLVR